MPETEESVKEETLEDLTINAFMSDDFAKAGECAAQMLKEPEKSGVEPYWREEEVRYWGHIMLGLVAAHCGDEGAGKAQFLEAGEMPAQQTLDKSRPNLNLLNKFYEAGEKEAYITHLQTSVRLLNLWGEKQKRWIAVLDHSTRLREQALKRDQSDSSGETD